MSFPARFALLWGALALLLEAPQSLIGLFCVTALFALQRASWGMRFFAAIAVLFSAWSSVLSQGLFYPGASGDVWFHVPFPRGLGGDVPFYLQGVQHGLLQSLRFSIPSLLALGLIARSQQQPASPATGGVRLILSLSLRHLPPLAREATLGWRTARLLGETPLHSAWRRGSLFAPLLGLVLRRARRSAEGLFARDLLSVHLPQTPAPPVAPLARFALLGLTGLVLILLCNQGIFWLYQQGILLPEALQRLSLWLRI